MTSKKSIIIFNDYKDLTVTIICALIGFITFLIYSSKSDEGTKLTMLVIFVISAVVSLNYSIKSNNYLLRALLSFIIKMTLSLILLFKLLQLITDKGNESVDVKVRERMKRWQLISTGIFSFLVFEMIKEHRWNGDIASY
jgi:hypothetical protein